MRVTRTAGTALVLLVVLAVDVVGSLAWSGGATAAPSTGTLTGTAYQSTCFTRPHTRAPQTWRVHVVLQQGTKVVGRRTVIYSLRSGHSTERPFERPFTFRVPAGTYVVSGADSQKTVVIKAGETTKVTLHYTCS